MECSLFSTASTRLQEGGDQSPPPEGSKRAPPGHRSALHLVRRQG